MVELDIAPAAQPFDQMDHPKPRFYLTDVDLTAMLLIGRCKVSDDSLVDGIGEYYDIRSGRGNLWIDGCGPEVVRQGVSRASQAERKHAAGNKPH